MDTTAIWGDQLGHLRQYGDAEMYAYSDGISAFNLALTLGNSDPDALEKVFLDAALRRCVQYYGS